MRKFIAPLIISILLLFQSFAYAIPYAPNATAAVAGTADDIALTADGDFGDYDIHSIDGLYGVDDQIYIDMGTDGYLDLEADVAIRSTSVFTLIPDGVGSQDVISIVPSAALTTASSEWDGIHIDASALDPTAAATSTHIHGAHIDMSGVLRTYAHEVEAMHLEGLEATAVAGQAEPGTALHSVGKIRVDFDATQSAAGITLTALDMVIDTTGAAAGKTHALDVATSGGGTSTVAALGTHTGVDPLHQHVGAFQATGANYACEETSNGTVFDDNLNGETVFVADDDTIVVGAAATFDEIEIILTTAATKDCFLQFFYNTAIDTWVRFYPADDTDGMTQSGTIRFGAPAGWTNDGDPDGVGVAADAGYWIKIQRTRVASPGTVVISTVKTLSATEYYWDKNGAINVSAVNIAGVDINKFSTVTKATSGALSVAECSDTLITNQGWASNADLTLTLPDADTSVGAGLKFKFLVVVTSDTTEDIYFDTEGTTTNIYLNGVAVGDGQRVWTQEPAIGESISCHTATQDGTTYDWYCDSINGVWLDFGS